ncbi:hypothetical protein TUM4644_06590 [Shewanella colwelliana]|nr:hypothetical protein TUM4644_06590 [Shewanella colwelliana]
MKIKINNSKHKKYNGETFMKLTKLASAVMALSVGISTQAFADDDRYVIQVENGKKRCG